MRKPPIKYMNRSSSPRIAIVYDRVNKFGGAERVLCALRESISDQLYTLVYERKNAKWADKFVVKASIFNRVPFFRTRHELLAPVAAIGFESFDFAEYDLVISITSSDAKAIITRPGTVHICYCLTPPRYLWGMEDFYKKRPGFGIFSNLARGVFAGLINYMKESDTIYSSRPDAYIAISKEVQKRIKKIYHRDSQVVYPPVDYDFFSRAQRQKQDYYLVVSRLVPYKKVSLVIKAFNDLGLKLVIVGGGSERKRLEKMSKKNICFAGEVSDDKLRDYYAGAKALIFPQLEDFGITPLEAQATGTPVIAYGKGGALETIIEEKTGVFFDTQSSGAIMKAVKKFETLSFNEFDCKDNAKRFDNKYFVNRFTELALNLYNELIFK